MVTFAPADIRRKHPSSSAPSAVRSRAEITRKVLENNADLIAIAQSEVLLGYVNKKTSLAYNSFRETMIGRSFYGY